MAAELVAFVAWRDEFSGFKLRAGCWDAASCLIILNGSCLRRLGHGYGYKWTDPGRTASGYHLEAILLDGYPLLKNGADLGDYDVILAYFRVRFRGEVSTYSSKTRTILPLSLLIIISSLSSLASSTP